MPSFISIWKFADLSRKLLAVIPINRKSVRKFDSCQINGCDLIAGSVSTFYRNLRLRVGCSRLGHFNLSFFRRGCMLKPGGFLMRWKQEKLGRTFLEGGSYSEVSNLEDACCLETHMNVWSLVTIGSASSDFWVTKTVFFSEVFYFLYQENYWRKIFHYQVSTYGFWQICKTGKTDELYAFHLVQPTVTSNI